MDLLSQCDGGQKEGEPMQCASAPDVLDRPGFAITRRLPCGRGRTIPANAKGVIGRESSFVAQQAAGVSHRARDCISAPHAASKCPKKNVSTASWRRYFTARLRRGVATSPPLAQLSFSIRPEA